VSGSPRIIPTRTELSSTITPGARSLRCKTIRWSPRAVSGRRDRGAKAVAKARHDAVARARLRPVLPQRVEHDLADRLAGLARQRARELRGFGVADMNLIPHGCFPCVEQRENLIHMYIGVDAVAAQWSSGRKAIACPIRRGSYSNRCATRCRGSISTTR
jgi:hypothetical protein